MSALRPTARAAAVLLAAWSSAAPVSAAETTATLDVDGDGQVETVRVRGGGRKLELTIADATGRRRARVRVASPAAGTDAVAVRPGELGSAGALLEVEASGGGQICRSVWRLREKALDRIPVREGAAEVPDCEEATAWSVSWERPDVNATALYRRARTHTVDGRRHEEVRRYPYTGFALERDPARGTASVDGIEIPSWPAAELFPRATLDRIQEAFDFDPVRKSPRLYLDADRDAGLFRARLRDSSGELSLPIRSSAVTEPGVQLLEASDGPAAARVTVLVRDGLPVEATVTGLGDRFDRVYYPVSRRQVDRIVLYRSAEEDLARETLPGAWSGLSGGRVMIRAATGGPARIEMDDRPYRVAIWGAPEGTDVLLLPPDGAGQAWALDLRTVDGFTRVPVRCAADGATNPRCEAQAPAGELFRRVGARLNAP